MRRQKERERRKSKWKEEREREEREKRKGRKKKSEEKKGRDRTITNRLIVLLSEIDMFTSFTNHTKWKIQERENEKRRK